MAAEHPFDDLPVAPLPRRFTSFTSRSLSKVRRASQRNRLMSVIDRPIKTHRLSLRAESITRLAKASAVALVDQYCASVNTSMWLNASKKLRPRLAP